MARLKDFQAAILEESILYLIRVCGYKEVGREQIAIDNTLEVHRAGMGIAVKGRGASHQVDCIGDYLYTTPLCNPTRLLGETKFYGIRANGTPYKVGIGDIRDSVGLLKDVSEYFNKSTQEGIVRRYSYQSVFFSATGFSKDAQDLAYAHDINLISAYAGPSLYRIVEFIRNISITDFNINQSEEFGIRLFRDQLRRRLRGGNHLTDEDNPNNRLSDIINSVIDLDKLFLGTIDNKLTVMMTPLFRNETWLDLVEVALSGEEIDVELYWETQPNVSGDLVFTVTRRLNRRLNRGQVELFEFLVPEDIYNHFIQDGILLEEEALNMKEQYFSNINIAFVFEGTFSILRLRLDREWMERVRREI